MEPPVTGKDGFALNIIDHNSISGLKEPRGTRQRRSCEACRWRKMKCDRGKPCSSCVKRDVQCTYESDRHALRANIGHVRPGNIVTKGPLDNRKVLLRSLNKKGPNIWDRLDAMEKIIMSWAMEDNKKSTMQSASKSGSSPSSLDSSPSSVASNRQDLSPTSADSEVVNLRQTLGLLKLDRTGKSIYHGNTHWGTLFGQVKEVQFFFDRLKQDLRAAVRGEEFDPTSQKSNSPQAGTYLESSEQRDEEDPALFSALPQPYIWCADPAMGPNSSDLLGLIPERSTCDKLVLRFFDTFEPCFPIIHRSSFYASYDDFWAAQENSELLWLGQLYAVLILATQSYPRSSDVPPGALALRASAADNKAGRRIAICTAWLDCVRFCSSTGQILLHPSLTNIRILLLQLFVESAYGVRSHGFSDVAWIRISQIVRLCQSMGLHREPKWFVMSPYIAEERRRVWSIVRHLDCFYSVIQGLPLLVTDLDQDVEEAASISLDELSLRPDSDCSTGSTPQSSHIHPRFPPDPERFTEERFRLTFWVYRSRLSRLTAKIYSVITVRTQEYLSNEKVASLDQKIRRIFNDAPSQMLVHPLDSTPSDSLVLVINRFLYRLEFLKLLVILHRPFAASTGSNDQFALSREKIFNASWEMLELQAWFYRDPRARHIYERFVWIANVMLSPIFVHATLVLAVDLLNTPLRSDPQSISRQVELLRSSHTISKEIIKNVPVLTLSAYLIQTLLAQVEAALESRSSDQSNGVPSNSVEEQGSVPRISENGVLSIEGDKSHVPGLLSKPQNYQLSSGQSDVLDSSDAFHKGSNGLKHDIASEKDHRNMKKEKLSAPESDTKYHNSAVNGKTDPGPSLADFSHVDLFSIPMGSIMDGSLSGIDSVSSCKQCDPLVETTARCHAGLAMVPFSGSDLFMPSSPAPVPGLVEFNAMMKFLSE